MSTPSISDLRKRQNISKKKRNLKEPEPIETFEEYRKRIEKEREEQKERGKIRDPLEDEKLVQEWMKEEEDKKKKRMDIASSGGRDRPLLLNKDVFYDRDYCALFIVIFLMDMVVPLFELYCALDGFGFNKFNEQLANGRGKGMGRKRGKYYAKSEFEKNQEIVMKSYESIVRLMLYCSYYMRWFTWIVCILEIAIRYFFLSSADYYKDIPNLIDVFFGSFIAFFYNKPLCHLFRFYGIFLRLHLIYSDEKDIAVGAVELKLEKCLKKLNKQTKALKQNSTTIESQDKELARLQEEVATLQQALFFAAKAAEDDTEYFFKALDEVGAFSPEDMSSIKDSLSDPSLIETIKSKDRKTQHVARPANDSGTKSKKHHHGHSHAGHSHGHSASKDVTKTVDIVKGKPKRKFQIRTDGKMLEKKL